MQTEAETKKSKISELNDYQPVGLISRVMKGLERIVLAYLRPQMMDYWLPDGEATSCEIRQHSVWFGHVQCRSSTGAVLSPFLFILYSSDFQYNSRSLILQWLDELFVRQKVYRVLVNDFVKQSGKSHLLLYVRKMREIQFRRKKTYMAHVYRGTGCDVVG